MTTRTLLLLLTSDAEFERTACASADLAGYDLVIGRNPSDGARLFARYFDHLDAVVVDLDICKHGSAWLGALTSLSRKIPALAVSRLDPRLLKPLALRNGADHWASKPITADELTAALQTVCPSAPKEKTTRSRNSPVDLRPPAVKQKALHPKSRGCPTPKPT